MTHTRRRFLDAAGTGVAAAGLTRLIGCAPPPEPAATFSGAPGVDLMVRSPALPGLLHDLERYLVRLSDGARERRRHLLDAISTRPQVLLRQEAVVRDLWTMLGGPLERGPLNPRVTGVVERPGYRIEKLTFESRPLAAEDSALLDESTCLTPAQALVAKEIYRGAHDDRGRKFVISGPQRHRRAAVSDCSR